MKYSPYRVLLNTLMEIGYTYVEVCVGSSDFVNLGMVV